jgi:iron(III) transport system substrate-binding protein
MVSRNGWRTRSTVAISSAVMLMCAGLAACGGSPTDAKTADPGGQDTLTDVYEAVDGLEGDARYDKLLELAKDAGGTLTLYHASDLSGVVDAFKEKTGVKVEDYKATAEQASERLIKEKQAGSSLADVFLTSSAVLPAMRAAGVVAPLKSPALDVYPEKFSAPDVIGPFTIFIVPSVNADKVDAKDVPQTWKAFFEDFKGKKAIELTDWQWYRAMVLNYLVPEEGMTEDQAIKMVTNGLKGAFVVDGHSLMGSLLSSGQYDYAPTEYAQTMKAEAAAGAPDKIALGPDMPPFATEALPAGLVSGSKNPAAGLLFLEYMSSQEGQRIFADMGYAPTSSEYQGESLLSTYPNAIPIASVADPLSAEEADKWAKAFDAMLQEVAGKTLKE